MPRQIIPFVPLSALCPGDQLRLVLLTGDVCIGVLVRSGSNWLTVREGSAELQFRLCDLAERDGVPAIQRIESRQVHENFVGLIRGGEEYSLVFRDHQFGAAMNAVSRWAKNPELSFSFTDCAVLMGRLIQMARVRGVVIYEAV